MIDVYSAEKKNGIKDDILNYSDKKKSGCEQKYDFSEQNQFEAFQLNKAIDAQSNSQK